MAEIRMGQREGNGHGKEIRVAADQYMARRGGHFVYLDSGAVTMVASNTEKVYGWAESPKDAAGYSSWKSSSVANSDDIFVIDELDGVFEMPYDASATTLSLDHIGETMTIAESGVTYSQVQEARYDSALAASLLVCVDVDLTNQTVLVKMKPSKKQTA